jgi:hypothetical protein
MTTVPVAPDAVAGMVNVVGDTRPELVDVMVV